MSFRVAMLIFLGALLALAPLSSAPAREGDKGRPDEAAAHRKPGQKKRARSLRVEADVNLIPTSPLLKAGEQIRILSGQFFLDYQEPLELSEGQVYHLNLLRLRERAEIAEHLAAMEKLGQEMIGLLLEGDLAFSELQSKAAEMAQHEKETLEATLRSLEAAKKILRPEQWMSWKTLANRFFRRGRPTR